VPAGPAKKVHAHQKQAPRSIDQTKMAADAMDLHRVMPRRLSAPAAACVDRCMVSVMTGRTASARAAVALLGFGDALKIF
jgi:hypothetical protein